MILDSTAPDPTPPKKNAQGANPLERFFGSFPHEGEKSRTYLTSMMMPLELQYLAGSLSGLKLEEPIA